MNDTLRRALLQAQLSEDDVAARLAVDPKTVRRWMEGRVPFTRHRWELARLLGRDEIDLWPRADTPPSRPKEVLAVYPRRDTVPTDLWSSFFAAADRAIDILDAEGLFLAGRPDVMTILTDKAQAGIQIRVCIQNRGTVESNGAIVIYGGLCQYSHADVRVHRSLGNNTIYRADDQLLICQPAYGISFGRSPVLHLSGVASSDIAKAYLESFEKIWVDCRPSE